MFITQLPDEAVTKLYLKYRHLPSLQDSIFPGVKDPQHLSHEEAERVMEWFQGHMMKLEEGRASLLIIMMARESSFTSLPLTLVEAGVTDEEACSCSDMSCKENFIVSVIIFLVFVSCSNVTPLPSSLVAQTSSAHDGYRSGNINNPPTVKGVNMA